MCEESFPKRCVLFFSLFFFLSFLFLFFVLFCFETLEKCREVGERKLKPRGVTPKDEVVFQRAVRPSSVDFSSVPEAAVSPPLVDSRCPHVQGGPGVQSHRHTCLMLGRATEQGMGPLLAAALGRACTLAQPGPALQTNRVLFENKP